MHFSNVRNHLHSCQRVNFHENAPFVFLFIHWLIAHKKRTKTFSNSMHLACFQHFSFTRSKAHMVIWLLCGCCNWSMHFISLTNEEASECAREPRNANNRWSVEKCYACWGFLKMPYWLVCVCALFLCLAKKKILFENGQTNTKKCVYVKVSDLR